MSSQPLSRHSLRNASTANESSLPSGQTITCRVRSIAVSYTHLDVYKRQLSSNSTNYASLVSALPLMTSAQAIRHYRICIASRYTRSRSTNPLSRKSSARTDTFRLFWQLFRLPAAWDSNLSRKGSKQKFRRTTLRSQAARQCRDFSTTSRFPTHSSLNCCGKSARSVPCLLYTSRCV